MATLIEATSTSGSFDKSKGGTKEGPIAKMIEKQTSKIPSDVFLGLAIGAMTTSLVLQIMGKKKESNFIGQWAPTILILGLYNKIVKVVGSERKDLEEVTANNKTVN